MIDPSEKELVQIPASHVLEELGWRTYYAWNNEVLGPAGSLGRSSTEEVLLARYFKEAMKRLNPWMKARQMEEAISAMRFHSVTDSLLATNEKKYDYIRNGISVTVPDPSGGTTTKKAMLIDFRHPERDDFLAVMEPWLGSKAYNRRADMVGFVNGIPLIFFEFKRPDVPVENAYKDNYTDYQKSVPQLFYYNAFSILSNGLSARVGTLGSSWKFFGEWKHLKENDESQVELSRMLKGMCNKENLLDLVENFILYDRSNGGVAKILAHNHQFLGVNEAFEAYKQRKLRDGKLGVFWHTQGSGKSYSMVFLTKKILRVLGGSPTFLLLTDRDDLNDQLADTFEGCGLLTNKEKKESMPSSGKRLIAMLRQNKTFIFSLIQKFNQPDAEPIHTDHDILVISDEAHRTQYGVFAENMMRLLPDASRIGFTGTPLFKFDNITARTFGDYVSIYDFRSALEDHATVPLYYENRGEEILHLENPDMTDELISVLDDPKLAENERARESLARHIKKEVHILMAKPRLEAIARDFVDHYSFHFGEGKAMFVALNRVAAVKMYELVQKYWLDKIAALEKETPEKEEDKDALARRISWMKTTEMHVIISPSQNEAEYFKEWDIDILPYRELLNNHMDDLKKDFKDRNHPFRVAFVCDMWLTGFNVKSLTWLYMDKPMKAHNLMQAIARANRVDDGKENGVIIDYVGILKPLLKALNDYAFRPGSTGEDVVKDIKKLKKRVLALLDEAEEELSEAGYGLDRILGAKDFSIVEEMKNAADILCRNIPVMKKFLQTAGSLKRLSRYLDKDSVTAHDRDRIGAVLGISRLLQPKKKNEDFTEFKRKIQDVMDKNIHMGVREGDGTNARISLSSIDFDKLDNEYMSRRQRVLRLEAIKAGMRENILRMIAANPNDIRQELYAKLQEIITGYNDQKNEAVLRQEYEELLRLAEAMTKEEKRFSREGFENEDELAVYDILVYKKDLTPGDIKKIKKCAKDITAVIHKKLSEMDHWKEKEQTREDMKYAIRNTLAPDVPESYDWDDVQHLTQRLYEHAYRHY